MSAQLKIVALGGGHGLAASLRALRRLTPHLTAIVGVSDNGGSSGRLRSEFDVIPPGDLRMALTALCADDDWGQLWARALQHRFSGEGELAGHALGNLIITALWQQSDDIVAGLDTVSALLGAKGRVLPLSLQPLDVIADVRNSDGTVSQVAGQVQVATTSGRVEAIRLSPRDAAATPDALRALDEADVIVMGPGSWFTSVINHLLLPDLAQHLISSPAIKILVSNMCSQTGETEGFTPSEHLDVLADLNPALQFDAVMVDSSVADESMVAAAARLGATLIATALGQTDNPQVHDPESLAQCVSSFLESASSKFEGEKAWQ